MQKPYVSTNISMRLKISEPTSGFGRPWLYRHGFPPFIQINEVTIVTYAITCWYRYSKFNLPLIDHVIKNPKGSTISFSSV